MVEAADSRYVAGITERLFGEVLLGVRYKPADLRSSSIQPVIWLSVMELMTEMVLQMAC